MPFRQPPTKSNGGFDKSRVKITFGQKLCQSTHFGVLVMFNIRTVGWVLCGDPIIYTRFELLPNLGSHVDYPMPSIIKKNKNYMIRYHSVYCVGM